MYIDGDTHYWPVNFLERVNHSGRGHIEFQKGAGEMIRYGERFPGDAATYYRDGKKIHSFSETRWNLDMHREVMAREGFDRQVVIADNLAQFANPLFAHVDVGGSVPSEWAWLAILAYTLQIYFDFSGYSDMAIGLALMFGIRLPVNFR